MNARLVDDEHVLCDVVWSGTHSGKPFDWDGDSKPATGNVISMRGTTMYTVRNGKITRIVDQYDFNEFLAGFGLKVH